MEREYNFYEDIELMNLEYKMKNTNFIPSEEQIQGMNNNEFNIINIPKNQL